MTQAVAAPFDTTDPSTDHTVDEKQPVRRQPPATFYQKPVQITSHSAGKVANYFGREFVLSLHH
jgi:hypothetical protein